MQLTKLLNPTAKNYLYNTSSQLLTILVPLVTVPYLARVLQPEGIGTYAYTYAITSYFVLFAMQGLNNYGNRAIARVRDNIPLLAYTFWSIYALQVLTTLLCVVGYFGFCLLAGHMDPVSICMSLFVIAAGIDINWYFMGLENFKLVALRNIAVKLLTTLSLFLFIKTAADVWIYALITALGTLLGQLVVWPVLLKQVPFVWPAWKMIVSHIKPNFILFIPAISVSFYKVLDKIMLGFMTGIEQVGFYESAEKILAIPLCLIVSFGTVMMPKMSHLFQKQPQEQFRLIILYSLLAVFFIMVPMVVGMMSIAQNFVPLFLGRGYDKCISLLWWLMPSCLFIAVANVVRTQILLPTGQDMVFLKSCIFGAILNVMLNIILIPSLLSIGAAIATLCAEISVCLYQVYYARQYIPFKQIKFWFGIMSVIALCMGWVVIGVGGYVHNKYLQLFVQILLGVGSYVLLSWVVYLLVVSAGKIEQLNFLNLKRRKL